MSFIHKFITVTRAFSFTVSGSSVILGTALAVIMEGASFNFINFLLAFIGMVLLHSAANIFADVYDYKKGIDQEVFYGCGAVVSKLITIKEAFYWIAITSVIGISTGLYLSYVISNLILIIGIVGVAIGFLYTAFGYGFKYRALGDFSVFINFGMLGTLGAWIVQTGEFSWLPLLWGLPTSFLVIAILHANNWRDIERDGEADAITVASLVGDSFSEKYYFFLILLPFILVALYVTVPRFTNIAVPALPWTILLVFLAAAQAVKLCKDSLTRTNMELKCHFDRMDTQTAKLHFMFTSLYVVGLLINYFYK